VDCSSSFQSETGCCFLFDQYAHFKSHVIERKKKKLSVKGIIKFNEKGSANSKSIDGERLRKKIQHPCSIHNWLFCLSWWCTRFSTGIVVSPLPLSGQMKYLIKFQYRSMRGRSSSAVSSMVGMVWCCSNLLDRSLAILSELIYSVAYSSFNTQDSYGRNSE